MNDSAVDFYDCPIRLDKRLLHLLWFSGDVDGVWSNDETVWFWGSESDLRWFAAEQRLSLSDEVPTVHDFDSVDAFVRGETEIDARCILDAWNLLVDIAASVRGVEFLAAEAGQLDVYNHVFYHVFYLTDLFSFRGAGPDPLTPAENDVIRQILSSGLDLLKARLEPGKTPRHP